MKLCLSVGCHNKAMVNHSFCEDCYREHKKREFESFEKDVREII